MSYAALLVAALLALIVAGGAGWRVGVKSTMADWNAEKVQVQETARVLNAARAAQTAAETASQAAKQRKVDDDLTTGLVAGADDAHSADERLRVLAANYGRDHPAAGAKCRNDAPPAARLSDKTRSDLVQLARDANDCAFALRAWQRREEALSLDSKETTP